MTKKKPTKNGELVIGVNPIIELLRAKKRKLTMLYTTKPHPKAWSKIAPLLPQGLQINYVSRDALTNMAETTDHQSLVGWATPFEIRKKPFVPSESPFIIMLDGVQDPRNVGAIIRSAYCTGADGVVLITKGASPLTATALKASAGLAEHIPVMYAPSAAYAAQQLSKDGYRLYISMLSSTAQSATKVEFKGPVCLVIGSEGVGVSKDIVPYGTPIMLPQRRSDISYNASVAAGILLFMVGTALGRIE